jgi:hypothetical protein
MKKLIFALLMITFASAGAFGQTKTPQINKTQARQHARIHQGVKKGELTKGEAAKLRAEQRNIKRDKILAKSDGKVTRGERKIIKAEQKKASKDIYKLKHNARTR